MIKKLIKNPRNLKVAGFIIGVYMLFVFGAIQFYLNYYSKTEMAASGLILLIVLCLLPFIIWIMRWMEARKMN